MEASNILFKKLLGFLAVGGLLVGCNLTRHAPPPTMVMPTASRAAVTAALLPGATAGPFGGAPPTTPAAPVEARPSATPTAHSTPQAVRFAVIGDYGEGSQGEADVADLVKSWNPDFILTVGDNNYPSGSADTIDAHIGAYYSDYIYPYVGSAGFGGSVNRFFPTLGNHDYDTAGAQAYFDYFTLPGNERYYTFTAGPVDFFALDSDSRTPDGVSQVSVQAQWLQAQLAAAASPWQIVYFHHAPYSSGYHGSVDWMRWPFEEWGADAVLSGHDHTYERLAIGGIPYFVNGTGGGPIYYFIHHLKESQVRFNGDYGAMLVTADATQVSFKFITRTGEVIDRWAIQK